MGSLKKFRALFPRQGRKEDLLWGDWNVLNLYRYDSDFKTESTKM